MARKRLLILHNGTTRDGAQHIMGYFERSGLDVTSAWAAGNEFPDNVASFDGCLLTGSPHGAYEQLAWIDREHELIATLAQDNVPMLGVCFGSQILASALCGRDQVFRRESCEVGFMHLPLSEAGKCDRLTGDLEQGVDMFVWHNDEVYATHPEMVILASSAECPNQIWRYQNRPIWGIQGHPELTCETATALFDAERAIFERDGADIEQLKATMHDAPAAKTLLTRFADIVQAAA